MATLPAPLSPVPVGGGSAGIPLPNTNTAPPAPAISSERQVGQPNRDGGITPVDIPQKQRLIGDRPGRNE